MYEKLLSVLVLTILVTLTLIGCSGVSSTDSMLTVLSTTEGEVFVMKAGADDWTEAMVEMPLGIGDIIKTGDDSGSEITFFDGSTIELEAGTQIEMTALDSSPDSDTKTIALMQTIGTTISRVTKLLDPASTYAVETPSGVAAARGSIMIVRIVFDDPNYPDGTILMTNLEGHMYWIGHGEELELTEGAQVIATEETAVVVHQSLAVADTTTSDEDTPVTVAPPGVLSNDSGLTVGDTLTVTAVNTSGTVGAVTLNPDGSYTYDPNGQFEYLEAGNSATDSFTYTVTDDYGIADTATVTITINGVYDAPPYSPPTHYPPPYYPPVNNPPVAVDDTATTGEDNPISVAAPGVLVNDTDPDVGDTLTVTSVDTSGTVGAVTLNPNGSYTYGPNGLFESLSVSSSITNSFTYTVSDGNGGIDTASVTITINGVNDPPQAENDSDTTPQATPVTIHVLGNDSDPDGDILTLDSAGPASNGTVINNGGDVTYTPNSGFAGTDSFHYTISDGNGSTDTATATVTVAPSVVEAPATLNIQIDTNAHAPIYVRDTTTGHWVINGDEETPAIIEVAGERSYSVWLGGNVTYYAKHIVPPGSGWQITSDGQTAYGDAAADTSYKIHFTVQPPS